MLLAVKEIAQRRKCREQSFIHFSREERDWVWKDTPDLKCRGFMILLGHKGCDGGMQLDIHGD